MQNARNCNAAHAQTDHAPRAFAPGQMVRSNYGVVPVAFIAPNGTPYGHTRCGLVPLHGSVQCADNSSGFERGLQNGRAHRFSDALRATPFGLGSAEASIVGLGLADSCGATSAHINNVLPFPTLDNSFAA